MSDEISRTPAGSNFLVEPHDRLYPCVFEGDRLRSEARRILIDDALALVEARLPGAAAWTHFIMIGSGASWNWDEAGDLDVQVWVDLSAYAAAGGTADDLVWEVRQALEPMNFRTLADLGLTTTDCAGAMRVQYYVKPGLGTPEENLAQRPYACFDLATDGWIVRPEPITPQFYADLFLQVEERAKEIADTADDALGDLDRARGSASYWEALAAGAPDQRYLAERDEARAAAEQARERVKLLFDEIFGGRREAYTESGRGIHDERDALQKMLEVWGVFQRLKHDARDPLPWETSEG